MRAIGAAIGSMFMTFVATTAQGGAPATVREPKAFKADLLGLVILPSGRAPEAGSAKQFQDQGELFRAPLGAASLGELLEPAKFDMFGKPVVINAFTIMRTAVARGGDLADYPADPPVLCDKPQQNFAKSLAAASTLLLSTLLSRFQPWTQICLVDTDKDGTVDHAFMVGTRMPEDRKLFPIAPVHYAIRRNVPLPNSYLSLNFAEPKLLAGPRIVANVKLTGTALMIDRLRLGPDALAAKVVYGLKAKALPQTIDIAGGEVVIDALSPDSKTVTARYVRDVALMPFGYDLHPNIIFIYY
jgi:hypothetical protein